MNNSATVLVVDDDPRIRELLRSSLEAERFVVFEAHSSEELYKQLQEQTIDLITMDILLDRENGLDLVRDCLLYTSPSPRDKRQSRMPSSA